MDTIDEFHSQVTLLESEAKFRTIANAIPQMVWSTLPEGRHDYYNVQWAEYTGIEPGSMREEFWDNLLHPDDQERAWARWNRSLATGEAYENEYRLLHRSGEYRWCLSRALPVRNDRGDIVRWMGTCTDIHEQKLAQEKLQHADRRKDEFLAMLAHELRNPLAPIMSAATLLSRQAPDEARLRQISEVIYRQTRHMSGLIDDLMDVSRVTRGAIRLEDELVDLKLVLHEAYEQVKPLLESRHHKLQTTLPAERAAVRGDHKRLVQVIANLLSNAAKFTPNGGLIETCVSVDEEFVHVTVSDNGIGMSDELVNRAFDLFSQGERSLDRAERGLGIGLALVRSLVQQHGGNIVARSDGKGLGSEFIIALPRTAECGNERRRLRREVPAVVQCHTPLRILVVDDDVDAAQLLALLLREGRHDVYIEYDAVSALKRVKEITPDVCLLDIGLPCIDGYQLASHLRELPGLSKSLLVAITGHGQPEGQRLSVDAGFDHYFVKPVDPADLFRALSGIPGVRHA